jgi:glutamate racemase
VVAQPCPGLVELVEEGEFAGERVREALTGILEPLRRAEVDAVVLGCTHYPFLQEEIARVLGPQVTLIDSAPAVARQTRRVLEERGLLAAEGEGSLHVVTSGDPERVRPVATRLWGAPLEVERVEV